MKKILCCLLVVMAIGVISGCKGEAKPDGMPELSPCFVTIIQDGSPLAEATVTFRLVSGDNTWRVSGRTNESGVASLTTQMKYDGAPVGQYKVLVSKIEQEASVSAPEAENADAPVPTAPGATYALVVPEFDSLDKTPLTADVVDGNNEFKFDVGKAVKTKL